MSTESIKTNGLIKTVDLFSTVRSTYSALINDGAITYKEYGDGTCIIDLQIKTSSAISSGSVSLPSSVKTPTSNVHGALATNSNVTGWAQVGNGLLFLRCGQTNAGNYMCGQIVYKT